MAQGSAMAKACIRAAMPQVQYSVRGGRKALSKEHMRRRRLDRLRQDIKHLRGRRRVVSVCLLLLSLPLTVLPCLPVIFAFMGGGALLPDGSIGVLFILLIIFAYGIISLVQNISFLRTSARRIARAREELRS